jgi:hypothetical protein
MLTKRLERDSRGLYVDSLQSTMSSHFSVSEKNYPIQALHRRMQSLIFIYPGILKRLHPLWYDKLCYAIEQNLDKYLPLGFLCLERIHCLFDLLNKDNIIGKRYHALFSASGDDVSEISEACEKGIKTFEDYVEQHFPEYGNGNNENIYVVFHDDNHPNMEPFYRFQECGGNCFLQAPLLLHWYLSLWFDKTKTGNNVFPIDLEKYVRRTMTGKNLYKYIFEGTGGYSIRVLEDITGLTFKDMTAQLPYNSYIDIKGHLEKYGPALVIMNETHQDFHDNDKFRYEGVPKGKHEIHVLILVGIRKDEANQMFFLLQTFWKEKVFVEVQQQYFSNSGGHQNRFVFILHDFEEMDVNRLYSQKSGSCRISVSAELLERSHHPLFEHN